LSATQLKKGQFLDPMVEGNFVKVDGRVFYKAIKQIRYNDMERSNAGLPFKGLGTLSTYNAGEYSKMKCYLGKNNSSGYCIKGGGDLVSVFSSQKSSADAIMVDAVKNGAKTLDCYAIHNNGKISGPLYNLYSKYGFKIDKSMNDGKPGEPYTITKGISLFVNDKGVVEPDNPSVVVFMKK